METKLHYKYEGLVLYVTASSFSKVLLYVFKNFHTEVTYLK